MKRILRWTLLFIFVLRCLADDQCDEDCILQKQPLKLSANVRPHSRHKRDAIVHVYGIDTSNDQETFELMDSNKLAKLTEVDQVCHSSKVSTDIYRHAVVEVKSKEGSFKLIDVFVFCTKSNLASDQGMLEDLILKYVKQTEQRVLGDTQYNNNTAMEACLDEDGFIAPIIKDDDLFVSCFSFIRAVNKGAYNNNTLVAADVDIYSGPISVNRIDQSTLFPVMNRNVQKKTSLLGQFYNYVDVEHGHQWFCHMYNDTTSRDTCYVIAGHNYFGALCCCYHKPLECALHYHRDASIVCGVGKLEVKIDQNGVETYSKVDVQEEDVGKLKQSLVHKQCKGVYVLSEENTKMVHTVSGVDTDFCMTLKDGAPLCQLDITICPTKHVREDKLQINCCCRDGNLCNIDFTSVKAFERLAETNANRICEQTMIYSFLFTRNYTIVGDDRQMLCPIHYDTALKKVVDLQTNNNVKLLRDNDYGAYRKEGCTVVAALILPPAVNNCKDDVYTAEATQIPRPIMICTCKGLLFNTALAPGQSYCDKTMRDNIGEHYKTVASEQMPKCLKLSSHRFDEYADPKRIIEDGEETLSDRFIFCYAKIKQVNGTIPDLTAVYNMDAGVADVESGFSKLCFELYENAPIEQRTKPFCDKTRDNEDFCCTMALERKTANSYELLKVMQTKIRDIFIKYGVSSSPGYNNYKPFRKTSCLSSLNTQRTEDCSLPMGCFWTENPVSNRVSVFQAGCISRIPEIINAQNDDGISKELQKALRTCYLDLKGRKDARYAQTRRVPHWDTDNAYNCFATNNNETLVSNDESEDDVKAVFIVCCCTELNVFGNCEHDKDAKKDYGLLMKEFVKHANNITKSYPVPF